MERYIRQIVLPQIGEAGQEKLAEASVAVIGLGALGCLSSMLLVRAGVGQLFVIDRDVVELDNLQRQILYREGDLGESKATVARKRLRSVNSAVDVQSIPADVIPKNTGDTLGDVDVVVDGLDNMKTRFVVNDYCVKNGIPFVYGGAMATYGMTMTIVPERTACFECLFPFPPSAGSIATCETEGILNTVPATISSIQTTDALKLVLGEGVGGNLLTYDAWLREINQIDISRNDECPSCGTREFRHLVEDESDLVISLCGRNSVSITPKPGETIDFDSLSARLQKVGKIRRGEGILTFTVQDNRMTIFQDGRVLISGTDEISKARSLYSRYIGD